MTQRLTDMKITNVALVDKGANRRKIAVLKRDGEEEIGRAFAAGLAKGLTTSAPGIRGAITDIVHKLLPRRVEKSAADMISRATMALTVVLQLIEDEAADTGEDAGEGGDPDAAEDAADVAGLRSVAQGLSDYISATAKEVGTPDDLEDIAEDAARYAVAASAQMPIYMRDVTKAFKPFVKAPADAGALKSHLTADGAKGHGVADSKTSDASMGDLTKLHDSAHSSGADHAHPDGVSKGLKQFSGSRTTRLKEAYATLASILEEIEQVEAAADEPADKAKAKKRAQPEEVDVTSEELAALLDEKLSPIVKRLEAVEVAKAETPTPTPEPTPEPAPTPEPPAPGDDTITNAVLLEAVLKLADRIEKIEKAPGERQSIQSQDGVEKNGKPSLWAGMF